MTRKAKALTSVSLLTALGIVGAAGYNIVGDIFNWHWAPPTSGSFVAYYEGEIKFRTHDANPRIRVWVDGVQYEIRVAGVDTGGRRGVWSDYGDSETPIDVPPLEAP